MVDADARRSRQRASPPGWTPARCAPRATRCAPRSTIWCSARPGAARVVDAAEPDQHLPQRGHRAAIGSSRSSSRCNATLATIRPVVELMYLCASLGFERALSRDAARQSGADRAARWRLPHHPPAPRRVRARVVAAMARASTPGYRPLAQRVPLWMLCLGTLTAACLIYLVFNFSARRRLRYSVRRACRSAAAWRRSRAARRRAGPAACGRGRRGDAAGDGTLVAAPVPRTGHESRRGQVLEDAQSVTVRLLNRNMFGSGSAALTRQLPAVAHAHRDRAANREAAT